MDDINMNDELVERQAAYNLHFLPLPGRANDRETQMARLQDYMIADRDEDAAKRVRDYYGEGVPVRAVSEKAMQYFVGAAMARNLGISGAPEAYWLGREKPEALPEVEQQDDLYTEMGRDLITKTQDAWVEQQVKLQERRQTLGTVLQQIVQEGEANKKESAAWLGFLDAQGRGVWSEDEQVSLVKATEAFSMMRGLMDDPQSAGANVLTKGSTGQLIFDALYGDEMATGLFFSALQDRIADMKTAEEERNALVQFAHAFEAATKNLTAGMMGGHFRTFVTDEQVEEFNANRARHETFQAVLQGAAGADYEAAGGLSVMEDMRLQEIAHAARESGQLNADGSLRKMTDEERRSTQELNEFRGQLHNAVQGVYDIDGLAKLGKMMPGSLAYLVPGGMLASAMSMRTHDLASQLGEGSDWVSANARATVNAAIQAGVEKMAFGSIKATKMAPGLDALMSTGPMARVFGKLYGTTAGRIGMGVVAGGLEETFAEPAAGLLLSGIYNAFAPTGLELDSPWVEYKNEMAEMLKPDQILATALYGLLLGGVNVPGHRAEAKHYKKVVEGLERIGIDHNVAANMARSDGSLQQIAAGVQQVDAALKKDAGGVFGYIAELYPQLQEISTFENLMRAYNLPKMLPGEGGNVRVQYKDDDGKVQELVMSQEAGRLFVQARIEQLGSKVQVGFADMVLGQVMTGKVAEKSDSWVVSVEDADMNADYFRRIAAAAGIRLSQGAKTTDIDPEIHPYIPLGTLAQQGRAWESRMRVARGEAEEKLGRKLTDEEWAQREKQLVSRVNRVRVASQDGRVRTVLRVARGGYGAMEVLEDVTEDFLSLDMEENGRELGWYADNLLELERVLGRQGAFLHELKEGESYDRMAIIEGVGKLVQSKVLADTTRKYKLSEKLNAFLDMIRHLVQRAVAMLKLGKAINKVLADKEASAKLDPEFVGMVDRLVEKDVEFLRELQLEDGLAAMQRVLEQRVPSTPVLAEAEAKHGAEVREEMAAKAAAQRAVDADVAEGEAAVEGSMSADTASRYHVVDDSVELEKRLDDVVDVVEISFVEEEGKNWLKEAKQYFSLIAGRVFSLENTEGFTLKMPDHRAGRDTAVKGIRKKHQFKAEVIKKFEELFKKVVLLDRQIPAHKDKETPSRKKRVAAAKVFYKFGWPVRINGTEKMFWFGADAYDATNEKNVVFYEFGLQGMNEKGDSAVRTVLPDEEVEQGTESPLSAITLGDYLANVKLNPNQERVLPEVVSVDTETKEDSSLSVAEAEEAGLFDGGMLEASNAVVTAPSFSIEALHATPHRFRKFDTSKMGTGEGAQAFGWGLYFSGDKGSNREYYRYFADEDYQMRLFRGDNELGEKELQKLVREVFMRHGGQELVDEMEEAIVYSVLREGAQKQLADYETFLKDGGEDIPGLMTALQELAGMGLERKSINLPAINYRVELNADDSNLLMWDKKVPAELHDAVRELKSGQPARGLVMQMPEASKECWEGYRIYSELTSVLGTPKAASEWLAERGYKGIKYLDGMSRRAGEGTYNYVMFSGDDVKITGVNETGNYNAPWEDYEDETASFSVVGENAANWKEIKHLAFRGRDDGKLRVEIDASQAKLKSMAVSGNAGDEYRQLVAGKEMTFETAAALDKLREQQRLIEEAESFLLERDDIEGCMAFKAEHGMDNEWWAANTELREKVKAVVKSRLLDAGVTGEGKFGGLVKPLSRLMGLIMESLVEGKVNEDVASELDAMSRYRAMTLSDALDYPELYNAYPDLKWLPVSVENLGARTAGRLVCMGDYPAEIRVNEMLNADEMRSTLLHEIQHAIQSIEEFAKGGNADSARELLERQIRQYRIRLEHLRHEQRWLYAVDTAKDHLQRMVRVLKRPRAILKMGERFAVREMQHVETMAAQAVEMMWNEYREMSIRDYGDSVAYAPGEGYKLPGRGSEVPTLAAVEKLLEKVKSLPSRRAGKLRGRRQKVEADIKRLYEENRAKLDMDGMVAHELYLRLAGEIESRNVQLRRDWTAEQRAARPFNETLEYPGEALVSFSTVYVPLYHEILDTFEQRIAKDGRPVWVSRVSGEDSMVICAYPEVLNMITPWKRDVIASRDVVKKLMNKHGLLPQDVAKLPFALWNPVAVFEDPKADKGFIVITDILAPNFSPKRKTKKKDKELQVRQMKQVMAVLELRTDVNNAVITEVVSAYSADSTEKYKALIKGGYLRYADAERALMWASTEGDSVLQLLTTALLHSGSGVILKADLQNVNTDFSSSMVDLSEEGIAHKVVAAGAGMKANEAFVDKMLAEIRGSILRMRKLGSKTRTEREDALVAMGGISQMVKALVLSLPQGYRFAVQPYMNRLDVLTELATTGNVEMLRENVSKGLQAWMDETSENWHEVLPQLSGNENMTREELTARVQEMMKEHAGQQLTEAVERIVERVAGQLRKHAKDTAVKRIHELLERVMPKKDPKSGKLKGGKMSADAYRDLQMVAEALGMKADKLEEKLAGLRAKLESAELSEAERDAIEGELMVYDQFGDLEGMSAKEAVAALEALRQRIWMERFEWENIMAERRAARRAVVRKVVDGVGSISENEYNAKKRRIKPTKRLKYLGDILSGMPAALAGLRGYLPLRELAAGLEARANRAGELIKQWEAERWEALETLSKDTMGRSWRLCMDYMHEVLPTGVSFDRPKYRTVDIKVAALRELLAMDAKERKAEMKRRREAGGKEAETALSERDIEAAARELERMDEAGEVKSWVHAKYLAEVQHEENLTLSRGEALYAILMYEQPTYTERMEAQGYTPEVIAGFREFVGEDLLRFGYGLRELFALQGDRIAVIYEREFGVPFPREENYFAARWVVNGMKENPAEQLLAGMAGTPGSGNGWMKQRVNHNLELDMTKDALQVFLQATTLTDTWMATQDIVADFKAWTRDKDFERALTTLLGKEGYDNIKDWVRILELGGVQDCLNMGVTQDVINGLYGSGAVAILGMRVQTLIRQLPSVFNGLLGAPDISAGEWFATLARMKHGEAPMTYAKMKNSVLLKSRQQGRAGNMASQAMRANDSESSVTEELLLASMLPMEWVDASCTAMSLVPVWNIYYQRAVEKGASHAEAERAAWEQTTIVANLASQPIGILNRSKVTQNRSSIVKAAFFMLSESTAKFAMCRALWKGRNKMAAVRAWLVYGAANAAISALLDALQGDPEKFEEGKWWEYALSAVYGPLASIPGMGELVEELGTLVFFTLPGHVFDIEELKKAKTSASVGRALIDVQGFVRAWGKIIGFLTDDEEHSLAEYTRAASTISRTTAIATGWMGNMVGFWSTAVAVLMNPIDFGARVYRNMKQYYEEE